MGMNIAVIRRECGYNSGGAERYCAGVVQGLVRRGHRVSVIADTMEGAVRQSAGSRVKFLRAAMSGRGSLMKNMSFFMSVQQVLAEHQFDLIYGLSRVMSVDVLRISDPLHAAWIELGYRKGLFSVLRRFLPRHSSLLSIERKSISTARRVLTNSQMVAEQVRHYYGLMPERIVTIYNGFDPDRFFPVDNRRKREIRAELGLSEDTDVILWAGMDPKRKGLRPLIQALCTVSKAHNFCLVIAGIDSLGSLSADAEKAGITDRICLLGYTIDMAPLYQASDLFVLPTRYDPFANTCLEAAACGVPVVTTKFNGASEIVSGPAPWLVVDRADAASVARALERFFSMTYRERTELALGMADAALPHTWEHHVDMLTEFFASLTVLDEEVTDA